MLKKNESHIKGEGLIENLRRYNSGCEHKPIIKYKLVAEDDSYNIEDLVNDAISEGYAPIGGVAVSNDRCMQAMVKCEDG